MNYPPVPNRRARWMALREERGDGVVMRKIRRLMKFASVWKFRNTVGGPVIIIRAEERGPCAG